MMYYTTDPGARQAFIRALRDLADYLDRHPAIPVPTHGATILLHAATADDGGRAQVDHIARQLLDAAVATRPPAAATTAPSAPSAPSATRSSPSPTRHRPPTDAPSSYHGCVTPDTWT